MMYSLNELILSGRWKMEEEPTHNRQSCRMNTMSAMPVKQENTEPVFSAIDHQWVPEPMAPPSSFHADLLSSISRTNARGSVPPVTYEEFEDPQLELSSWAQVGEQADEQLSRNRNAQRLMYPMGTEIWSPSQISSEDGDAPMGHLPSRATIPLYSLSTHMQGSTSQMKSLRKNATQTHNQPMRTYNGPHGSLRYQPDERRRIQGPAIDTVAMGQGCPDNCPCVCHTPPQRVSSHVTVFNEDQQRPGVIMVPVSRGKAAVSVMKHVPLQLQIARHVNRPIQLPMEHFFRNRMTEDDSDFEEEDKREEEVTYFLKTIDQTKARFKLSKADWHKIPIKSFPSGGRLLGGDWTRIFSMKIKLSNPWCSLRFKNNHVRSENSRKMHSAPFFRGAGDCKRPECGVKLHLVIEEEKGKYVDITYTGNVCHKTSY